MKNHKSLSNIEAFGEFKNSLKDFDQAANGDVIFNAKIIFYVGGNRIEETLNVKLVLQGYNGGTVSIEDEGDQITRARFHTEFKSQFGKYSFDSNTSTLIIEDKSTKMGSYKVEFCEA